MKQVNLLHNNYNRIGPYVTFQNKHDEQHGFQVPFDRRESNRNISKQINFINCFHSSRRKSQFWYPYCRIIVSVAVNVRHTVSVTESCTFAFKLQRFQVSALPFRSHLAISPIQPNSWTLHPLATHFGTYSPYTRAAVWSKPTFDLMHVTLTARKQRVYSKLVFKTYKKALCNNWLRKLSKRNVEFHCKAQCANTQ